MLLLLGALGAILLGLFGWALYRKGVSPEEGVFRSAEANAVGGNPSADPNAKDFQEAEDDETEVAIRGPMVAGRPTVGVYGMRTMADRPKWIAQYGGSPESERAVEEALQWLARHQADDGSWSRRCMDPSSSDCKCDKSSPCSGRGAGPYEMAHTGLALLAFQAAGHYDFNKNKYSDVVRKGLDRIVEQQHLDGGLFGSKAARRKRVFPQQYMYEHGIAAFALAEACALAQASGVKREDDGYRQAMDRAIAFIYSMQHNDGGWRYNEHRDEPSDTSVTGWQVLALKSVQQAGVPLDPECVENVRKYFDSRSESDTGRTGYTHTAPLTEATTGVGMLARQFLLDEADSPLLKRAAEYLAGYAEKTWPGHRADRKDADFYLWYNCTLGMRQAGGEPWERWNRVVRDTIIKLQRHEGCARGSWDPTDRWGDEGGRIYTTALGALTLEVYYRFASLAGSKASPPVKAATADAPSETPSSRIGVQQRRADE